MQAWRCRDAVGASFCGLTAQLLAAAGSPSSPPPASPPDPLVGPVGDWLSSWPKPWATRGTSAGPPPEQVIYLLTIRQEGTRTTAVLLPRVTRRLKAGGWGAEREYHATTLAASTASFVKPEDALIGRLLAQRWQESSWTAGRPGHRRSAPRAGAGHGSLPLAGEGWPGATTRPRAPGRDHLDVRQRRGPAALDRGRGRRDPAAASPWYVDPAAAVAGRLSFPWPRVTLAALLQAPPLEPAQAPFVRDLLAAKLPRAAAAGVGRGRGGAPGAAATRADCEPDASGRSPEDMGRPGAAPLRVCRDGGRSGRPPPDPAAVGGQPGARGTAGAEGRARRRAAAGRARPEWGRARPWQRRIWRRPGVRQQERARAGLVAAGPRRLARACARKAGRSRSTRASAIGCWSGWRLGRRSRRDRQRVVLASIWAFMIDGERVPLLPVLARRCGICDPVRTARPGPRSPPAARSTRGLTDGRVVALPADRVRPMLETLIELFDRKALAADGRLDISLSQALALAEHEAALQLRWLGGERLAELAARAAPASARSARPSRRRACARPCDPTNDTGSPGCSFIAELGLGGILADDMGLGKTIQTLAHILAEKAGRPADRPALVVVPDQPGRQLASRGRALRAGPAGAHAARRRPRADASPHIAERRSGADDLRAAAARRRDAAAGASGTWSCSTRRRRSRTRPARRPSSPAMLKARPPPVPDRHADREPSGRAVVAVRAS